MKTVRLTAAQAVIKFLSNQYVARDGVEHRFFAGCFGIFGHGNVAGIGQALQQQNELKYYQCRNEQSMVHTAAAYAKMKNRLSTFICTTSIGPGATNMITAAAGATINRLPVLLLPGDIFSGRQVSPVLQQLESEGSQDVSVNDCFKPISKYWDRINRPEQLLMALPEVMRVLTSPSDTGAVTLSLPQDVQAEAYDFPERLFQKRVWMVQRPRPDKGLLDRAISMIRQSKKPLIVAGGGAHYSEALDVLEELVEKTGMPVAETFAGKGALKYNNPNNLGAVGATGTKGAAEVAAEADLVIGIGTRYSDFTTASKTAFQNKNVNFININISAFDSAKHGGLMLVGDAKVILEEIDLALDNYEVSATYSKQVHKHNQEWDDIVNGVYDYRHDQGLSQGEIIGAVNRFADDNDVVLCAAGSLPGDLHKLWQTKNSKGFHLEYGNSCMGYEIAGGLGAKMADPSREIYVMVGDGSYLMLAQEIVTSIQENYKLTIVLINNDGYKSIGSLSRSLGSEGYGTRFLYRNDKSGKIEGDEVKGDAFLPVDLVGNAKSLGAHVIECETYEDLNQALSDAKSVPRTTVIYTTCDRYHGVDGYAWWEVPVAEVSGMKSVQKVHDDYLAHKKKQRFYY
ncbi:MAG: 3D-(3,5/4)-trihydroxycyclohexane-1,2-dione acylhydrolase (decyclizing) [Reichenbachiella sp.]|uniref:3D-(3,5/4)-trihydroxycyclohexane-1,2-dione acylhydrolase (decyclizing) n=1 Tax=Reichenbachiella sp. TaxID=2184521 RepID=UPI00296613A2|nr:3D-(3,5/4)-trihydroxycyclohexane-1,2-dione acylhydrolase (decyclizing) [Reichenbachiella sp.]MDW3212191.1 3D-(3,5/4)-trihydroxycyclohexane-1,2-dione acylhydrolase (decyclizing) [Reichenbachiella sp.]